MKCAALVRFKGVRADIRTRRSFTLITLNTHAKNKKHSHKKNVLSTTAFFFLWLRSRYVSVCVACLRKRGPAVSWHVFVCWRESVRDGSPFFVSVRVWVCAALTIVILRLPLSLREFSTCVIWCVVNHGRKKGSCCEQYIFLWWCFLFFACVFKVMRVKRASCSNVRALMPLIETNTTHSIWLACFCPLLFFLA